MEPDESRTPTHCCVARSAEMNVGNFCRLHHGIARTVLPESTESYLAVIRVTYCVHDAQVWTRLC